MSSCLPAQEPKHSDEEVRRVEEERIQVLNNVEELEQKIKELDNQVEESAREVGTEQRVRGSALLVRPRLISAGLLPHRWRWNRLWWRPKWSRRWADSSRRRTPWTRFTPRCPT